MVGMKFLKASGALGIIGIGLCLNGPLFGLSTASAESGQPTEIQKVTEVGASEWKPSQHDQEIIRSILESNPDGIENDAIAATVRAIKDKLRDPESAMFRDVRYKVKESGAVTQYNVCGYVNSKNGFGGYAGWRAFDYSIHFGVASFYPEGARCRR